MRNKLFVIASLLIMASMVLAACATPTPEKVVETVTVVQTVQVQQEGKTVIVTATPAPTAAPVSKEFKSKDPTTYTFATFGGPDTLDPAFDYETSGGGVNQNIYDTLVFYNKDDPVHFVPQLATEVPSADNGGISADGKTYTFKIRPGVKFHDGTPMTPSDVAFTFQRGLLQGGTNSPQWLLAQPILGVAYQDITDVITPTLAGKDVTTLNDDPAALAKVPPEVLKATCEMVTGAIVADDAKGTVTMKLASSWGPFLATVANSWGSIQSKAWVKANGGWDGDCATWQNFYGKTSDELNKEGLGSKAMGTGPYMLDHWTPGEELVLKANENYWRTEPAWAGGPTGAPKIKTVILKYIDEFSTRYAMMQAGDADLISAGSQANWPQLDQLTGVVCDKTSDACTPSATPDQPLQLFKNLPTITRTDMFFNYKINTDGGNDFIGSGAVDGNGIPADFFNDINIRKAFAYCFNYDQYLKDVFMGEGVRSKNVMLPGEIGYDENSPFYAYDPKKCEESFKASTWKSKDGKSLWDTGFRMTAVYNTGNTSRQTAAQILQAELSAINPNFVIEVTGLPWPTFLKNQRAKKLPVFFSGWQEDIHDPHNWVVPYTTGTYGGRQGMPKELADKFAAIYNRAVVESDPVKRGAIYQELNKLFYDEIPTVFLFVQNTHHYQQRWVDGYYWNPIYSDQYYYPLSKQ